ncbi:hypothetical protein [Pedobacter jejuensis]|uniref:Wadjet protein JetD C-terminal domain-containing protein n=1 Tax=Pedobacter jejuensis TaxID=1268550 RepID=A0A3N0BS42_9SPHI|nr:hypothetical protein [Pedobacter jejuensis]RNL51874.1 hypothetical protein D7004_13735 [Pedobacter jejuensis]
MNWVVLKALHTIYEHGEVKKNDTLCKDGTLSYLIKSLNVISEDPRKFFAAPGYGPIYEKLFKKSYLGYLDFMSALDILTPHTRFTETDLKILMNIQALNKVGAYDELKKQIMEADESLKEISLMFFKNEKYLLDKKSLTEALKKILGVSHFANEKDQQYIYKLECETPRAIVLCENLDMLTKPNKPRKHGIELWYAGGKNVSKLSFADTRGLPIFYCCDWDYDGLFIIYPLVKRIIKDIKLLTPNGTPRDITSSEHLSRWKDEDRFLSELDFTDAQRFMVRSLVINDEWVIEESNNLIQMLSNHINIS